MKLWWVRTDPCGIVSATLTIGLILFAQFTIVTVVILPWYGFSYHVILYSLCSIFSVISHCRAQFADPGAVPKTLKAPPLPDNLPGPVSASLLPKTCKTCQALKPKQAFHCSTCERCIIRMDHHCPWVNNCVAIFNQKYFILFLFYTALCCIYSGVMLVARFISCTHNMRQCTISSVHAVLCVLNFVEALVFGLFVIIMMFDQFSAIFEQHNPHEYGSHQKVGGVNRSSKYDALKRVFGEGFGITWFLPLNLPKQIMIDFHNELENCKAHANQLIHRIANPPVPPTAAAATAVGVAAAGGVGVVPVPASNKTGGSAASLSSQGAASSGGSSSSSSSGSSSGNHDAHAAHHDGAVGKKHN